MKFSLPLFALAAIAFFAPFVQAASTLRLEHLRCEYKDSPLGVDAAHPRLSWQLQSPTRGQRQTAYQIFVAGSEAALAAGRGTLWNTGKITSSRSTAIAYQGDPLQSGRKYWWKVRVWDKDGRLAPESRTGFWQMGLLAPSDWKAQWIAAQTPRDTRIDGNTLPPCPYVRRTFTISKAVRQATVFVTARGLYELHLNGAKVGDAALAPGWTDYRKRIEYQAYDVTAALHRGENAVGAILGDGWYSGYVGFARQRNLYGVRPELRLQINIEYADGTRQIVGTDRTWRGRTGPITYSDLLQGEAYDARRELTGWDQPGNSAAVWQPVVPAGASSLPTTQRIVTAPIAAMVYNNMLTVVAGNDIAGDPALNTVKSLRVEYALGGIAHTQTVREGETLHVPGIGETPGTLVIRRAVYGALHDPSGPAALVGSPGPPVRVTQWMPTRKIAQPVPGTYLFDLGQNMVGWARLKVRGPAGTRVRLRFGEILTPDGALYTTNLRSAHATDTYNLPRGWKDRDLGATLHVSRLSLCRNHRLSRNAGAGCHHRMRRRLGHAACRNIYLLKPDGQPASEQHRLGAARQLPERADGLPAA